MKKLLILLLEDDILGGVLSWPIRELGAKVMFYRTGADVRRLVDVHEPDVVLLDEPCQHNDDPCPGLLSYVTREWLKEQCRSVRVVWDASDTAWHPTLQRYKDANAFDLVIAADGAVDWPHREGVDLSLPTPVDPHWYAEPAAQRPVMLGFSGSVGNLGPRKDVLGDLEADGTLTLRRRGPQNLPYEQNAEFYKGCHAVVNVAHTTCGRLQCKARAIEACLAGCLLFETSGSPLQEWLRPEIDYLIYNDSEEVRVTVRHGNFGELCKNFGERARRKVLDLDLPRRFWSVVMGEQL